MGLRHYLGSTPGGTKFWTCPTCGTENAGPLEQGCPTCKAGADAKKVTNTPGYERQAETVRQILPALDVAVLDVLRGLFWQWYNNNQMSHHYEEQSPDVGMWAAFQAGYAAAKQELPGEAIVAAAAEYAKGPDMTDLIVRATLAAALAFYIDNTLSYGPIPGQLGAEDARALLAQLQHMEQPS